MLGRAMASAGAAAAPTGAALAITAPASASARTHPPRGRQAAALVLDIPGSPPGSGAPFGLAVAPAGRGIYCVDDPTNFLRLLH
jgi:hypothetical protein